MPVDFSCSCCGSCCRHIALFGQRYEWLRDASGMCRYFDAGRNLCSVYALRPLICRVREGYHTYFAHIPFAEYLRLTKIACALLQKLDDNEGPGI